MPFASISWRAQGPTPEIFAKNIWELGELEISDFLSRPFLFFYFISSSWKSVNIYNVTRMGGNFDDYPVLQQKSKCAQ